MEFKLAQEKSALAEYFAEFRLRTYEMKKIILSLEVEQDAISGLKLVRNNLVFLVEYASDYNIYPLVEPINSVVRIVEIIIRQENALCDDSAEILALLIDRLFAMAKEAAESGHITFSVFVNPQEARQALRKLVLKTDNTVDQSALESTIQILAGQIEIIKNDDILIFDLDGDTDEKQQVDASHKSTTENVDNDLILFEALSQMMNARHKHWNNRNEGQLNLALAMNACAGNPVNIHQLMVAIFLHDITMLQLPDKMLYKTSIYNSNDRNIIEHHPEQVCELMAYCTPGWDDATQMMHQHHEKADGTGYPNGLSEAEICDGALIVAICDAFFSITNLRDDRNSIKGEVQAASEINAFSGSQFSQKWVDIFNRVRQDGSLSADNKLDDYIVRKTYKMDGCKSENARRETVMSSEIDASQLARDLALFHKLAKMNDCRCEHWQKRTEFLVQLALGMNTTKNNQVDINQLKAAIYIHDIGMLQLPDDIIYKETKYDSTDQFLLEGHPDYAHGILSQRSGWHEAALIAQQHHEKTDGTGYPNGITDEAICDGAQIMAICDALYAMTHPRPDRDSQCDMIEAIREINSCSSQFAPKWVKIVNNAIHVYPQNWQTRLRSFLKKSRYFTDAPNSVLDAFVSKLKPSVYSDGDRILKQGQYNNRIFFLFSGTVNIYVNDKYVMDLERRGDLFGEMSVICNKPASAHVVAQGRVKTFSIHVPNIKTDFAKVNEMDYFLLRLFAQILTERLWFVSHKSES